MRRRCPDEVFAPWFAPERQMLPGGVCNERPGSDLGDDDIRAMMARDEERLLAKHSAALASLWPK